MLLICAALLLAGILGVCAMRQRPRGDSANTLQDNRIVRRVDLSVNASFDLEYEGRMNTIEVRDHRIRMLSADCPDQTCVRMGYLERGAPIVCLPNHLVIEFAGAKEDVDDLDAVVR